MNERNHGPKSRRPAPTESTTEELCLHPAWVAFVRYCQQMQHGEIEKLKIQDGIPVLVEVSRQKIKFS